MEEEHFSIYEYIIGSCKVREIFQKRQNTPALEKLSIFMRLLHAKSCTRNV